MYNRAEIFLFVGLAIIIVAIPFLMDIFSNQSITTPDDSSEKSREETNDSREDAESDRTQEIVWGVDSASYTEENLFQCVIENFGQPKVWGRYLEDREGVSYGLDDAEINFLHENDIQILIIYNHVNDARGFEAGVEHANQAIQFAENIGVPEGVAIFGDIEPSYPVDSSFMEGWYGTLIDSPYEPGIYGVFDDESELMLAFEAMDEEVQANTIVWSAYPQHGVTTRDNAPEFNPNGPELAPVLGWQYAIDAETCNIDTNLFSNEMGDYLW